MVGSMQSRDQTAQDLSRTPAGIFRQVARVIDRTREANLLWSIVVIALVSRLLFYAIVFEGLKDSYDWLSDDNYDEIAINVIQGNGYVVHPGEEPNTLRAPLYPFYLILHFLIFGQGRFYLVLMQSLFQAGACLILYAMVRRYIGDRRVSFLSALALALYPQSMLYSSIAATESLYLLLMMVAVAVFLGLTADKPRGSYVAMGFLLALLALCKPISQLMIVPVVLVILYRFHREKRGALKGIARMALTFCVALSPWTVRNYRVTGDFIPVATQGGHFFYSTTAGSQGDEKEALRTMREEGIQSAGEVEAKWLDLAVTNLVEHPGRFIRNTLEKAIAFWYRGHSRSVSLFNAVVNFPLLILGIIGMRSAVKRGVFILPPLAIIIYFNGLYGLMHALARYAFPIIPLVMIFGMIGLLEWSGEKVDHCPQREGNPWE